ncbi:MAG: hypothetical protein AB7U79_04490 [Candidatus Izemoplasmatales bacterium]
MKRIFLILALFLFVFVVGCSSNPNYASYANWNESDEDFVGVYLSEVLTLIDGIALEYDFDGNPITQILGNDSFEIQYIFNDFEIVFHFTNDMNVAFFYAQLWHYEESFENLLEYSKYEKYISFIDNVTNQVIFDYQGGVTIYKQIFEEKQTDEDVTCYYYHYDDMTGNIGYSIMWDQQYSQEDPRSVILFTFRGLLRNLGNFQ